MRARVLLRQSLFVPSAPSSAAGLGAASAERDATAGHVPAAAVVLHGDLRERDAFGVLLRADAYADDKGRPLAGAPCTLLVPASKIDHVWIEEG
jgi:hypothetical protein